MFRYALILILTIPLTLSAAPKKLLLVGTGPDGHPPTTHEYMDGLKTLAKLLKDVEGVEVTVVQAQGAWKEGPELMARADGVVLFLAEGAKWIQMDPEREKALKTVAKRGGGLTVLHWAMGTRTAEPIETCRELFGGCHGGPDRKYIVVEVEAKPATPKHPISQGWKAFQVKDEFYYQLKFTKEKGLTPILQVPIKDKTETVAWAWDRPDGGRSFGFSGLHFHANWKLPEYQLMVTQGVLWSLRSNGE